jgi:hypothetical protein
MIYTSIDPEKSGSWEEIEINGEAKYYHLFENSLNV